MIERAAVVGGGTMGNGIAHVMALAGLQTTLIEASPELAQRALKTIADNLERQARKGQIKPEDKAAALGRLKAGARLEEAAGVQIVVEAVPEVMDIKKDVFRRLDAATPKDAILATNTSSLSITEIAAATRRPERVIGMHFMNPVPVMKLVEVIRGLATSDETAAAVMELAGRLGKTPVPARDFPGFVANRILMPMINEAAWALMEGVASQSDIDSIMRLGASHPIGPLALADLIGLDVCVHIMGVLEAGYGEKFKPCPLLKKLVEAGRLGRKTGAGFFDYAPSR